MLSASIDNSTQPSPDEDWIAVRPFIANKCVNSNNEIVNLVSISVEKEKVLIVSREHNRLVTDDLNNNKQWCGIFSPKDLYRVHQQMSLIEPTLDTLFPNQLRPIKGLLSTYFTQELPNDPDLDLQDNDLCRDIIAYLHHAFNSLGKKLYIDILYNDISSDQYFDIYSELNLNRLLMNINELKVQLVPQILINQKNENPNQKSQISSNLLNKKMTNDNSLARILKDQEQAEEQRELFKQRLMVNSKHLQARYTAEDIILDSLLKLYAEYYNHLLKPLLDSRELAKTRLTRFEKKLTGQRRTCALLSGQVAALEQLEATVKCEIEEIYTLSENIDSVYVKYKQEMVDLHKGLLIGMKKDTEKFIDKDLGVDLTSFVNIMTKERRNRLEEEVSQRKMEVIALELRQTERQKDHFITRTPQPLTLQKTKIFHELQRRYIDTKLLMLSEEENSYKKRLAKRIDKNELKEFELDMFEDEDLVLVDYEDGLEMDEEHRFVDDDEQDFHDAYDDPIALISEIEKEKLIAKKDIEAIRKKITEIGARKSALRLSLNKMVEIERAAEEKSANEETNLNQSLRDCDEGNFKSPTVKTISEKKQEDAVQRELFVENRKKALQRLRDYKIKQTKKSTDSTAITSKKSMSKRCLSSRSSTSKHKHRVSPNNTTIPLNEITLNTLKIVDSIEFKPIMSSSKILNKTIDLTPLPLTTPPPAPPLPDFISSSLFCSTSPATPNISTITIIPPPPPPMPPISFIQPITAKKIAQEPKHKPIKNSCSPVEFDLNEIKTFKFKKNLKRGQNGKLVCKNIGNDNPWDCLMNEIRTNPCGKLKKVGHLKFSADHLDYANFQSSQLIRDLNLILNQRSRFFNDNEEDDDSSDEWDCSNED